MKPIYVLHKLLKGFIVTSDEQVEKGNIVLETLIDGKKELFEIHTLNDIDLERQVKVISQQDQIDFSSLSEEEQKEIGWYDMDNIIVPLSKEIVMDRNGNPDKTLVSFGREIFQKAQEVLSDRRFTLEDMRKAMYKAVIENWQDYSLLKTKEWVNNYLQSLSQPKSYKVELEMEDKIALDGHTVIGKEPKLTNGKIKILKLCQNNLV